jgi:hypothetical protein
MGPEQGSCAWIRQKEQFSLIQSKHFGKLCDSFLRGTPMSGLQMSDKRHRHAYSSGEFLLGKIQEAPPFTNQFTQLVRPRAHMVLSVTFRCHPLDAASAP